VKVLFVINSPWAFYNFRLNLAQAIKSNGYDVLVLMPFDDVYTPKIKKFFKVYDLYLSPNSINLFKDFYTLINMSIQITKIRPSLILAFTIKMNIYSSIVARFLSVPIFCNITGLGTVFISKNLIIKKIILYLYKFSLRYSNIVFFQNKTDKDFFLSKKIIPENRAKIIPGSGVDLAKFRKGRFSKKNKSYLVFLTISRLIIEKGIYELIDAIKIVKKKRPNLKIIFKILGTLDVNSSNPHSITIEEVRKWEKEEIVDYLGHTDNVEKYINQSDCVILPSYREGMPRSLLESFAMKVPVIATDVPGCADIVDNYKNGLLCKVRSSTDLADKIILMAEYSSQTRSEMGENGFLKIINNFDEKIVIDSYLKSINELHI